ncbi:bifunctional adenosylcobinamide kinase/adenosylcobinamide-phosphate guanylyltransferase [Prochlorococcus marinus]|uniref:Adenosylcobinamide kinase n=1 Tax=Prochlorococcus marinus XMU1408 TaxID=2213228 RepID=A0A318R5C1_PROMR|nr:bifunctional adenosylcobinamide kinase/adenosylcobinamide-phosphate guanylyltransferase [Prochlorococcus marinus]MBW3041974.1 adenosylcobinamide kinase [Prochlorococcus marinus str. XMU1408]PYE03294.1 adenosylcobinamide kinase [Prochlorococcus marinus XMU1408]
MLKPLQGNFKGLILISGPTNSGKSKLAEFLIKDQESITYIATSKPRKNDPEWQKRINNHIKRRPTKWKLIEYPQNICKLIKCFDKNESILIDSLGGLVEQYLIHDDDQWNIFQNEFVSSLLNNDTGFIIVAEEIGWGIVPATPIGHLFRERLSKFLQLLNSHASKKWLAINGIAIDLDNIGCTIP